MAWKESVVVDMGAFSMKYGLSCNGAEPPATVPSLVGAGGDGTPYIGGHLNTARKGGLLVDVLAPAMRGWGEGDGAVKLLAYACEQLEKMTYDQPIMLTVPPCIPRDAMEAAVQMLFETFNVPAAYLLPAPIAALHAAGKHEGIALDVGEGATHASPVTGGAVCRYAVQREAVGGAAVTDYVAGLLAGAAGPHAGSLTREHAVQLKEQAVAASMSYGSAVSGQGLADIPGRPAGDKTVQLPLPDGKDLPVSLGKGHLLAAEMLFRPALPPHSHPDRLPVQQVLWNAIDALPVETARELSQSVVVCGGTSLMEGFADRLQSEVYGLTAAHTKPAKLVFTRDRAGLVWRGAALTASLPQFTDDELWITKARYNEEGPMVVH
eukprot:TRINITY_DN22256_c0_g1_i1.p1 TRINITY_DN22256_c0_g1~~TRINITY_DN22256_c0_g1_i1.p1  ORF type:complete len:379 (+),score=101.52 TRINITY_DN22256_c0_g1_i1:57-1193(+)